MKTSTPRDLHFALDVGHSSLGWAVFTEADTLSIAGCGVVTFRADDCLASTRRAFRRQRRHIRSTRQRIARVRALLAHLGVLPAAELERPGCAWPWLLAARVLRGGKGLTWPELWDVLRWYAHNRGYDGNRRWSAAEEAAADEDTEKEANARTLMDKHGQRTMAGTLCAEMGLDPLGTVTASRIRIKGLNAAFPRRTVEAEVKEILRVHTGQLPQVDAALTAALFDDWRALPCPALKLPDRYEGGLLFGQLVPRFDNRIIAQCPVSGGKVPSRNAAEFREFRWAMQLANIVVATAADRELRPLKVEERAAIDREMRTHGALTGKQLHDTVRRETACVRDNLATMLMHPDAKEALLLDPVTKLVRSDKVAAFWTLLPPQLQLRFAGRLRAGKATSLREMRAALAALGASTAAFDAALELQTDAAATKGRKKDKPRTRDEALDETFAAPRLDGRAAYSREILSRAVAEVMAGKHPKAEGGCLFRHEEIRTAQLQRSIDEQTNNHLVRHRLRILERLVRDLVTHYAGGDRDRVARVTIEVNRDLREMSGKNHQRTEMVKILNKRLENFKGVVAKLEGDEAFMRELARQRMHRIAPGLIRKARIAEDLGWVCPYTGQRYEPIDLLTRRVDKDHIVPRSARASDSLDSLVITYSAVNKWKGKRTALKFIEDEGSKPVEDLPNLSIVPRARYLAFVEALETYKGHDDDKRRKRRRKEFLKLASYEEKEFTPGDLTKTSQLVRLGALAIRNEFHQCAQPPVVVSLPGSVTGTLRKGWNRNLLGCLSGVCPAVLDEKGELRTKTEVRDLTHLHHALDACIVGLAAHYIPNNGRIWELILKRKLTDPEKLQLRALGIFDFTPDGFGLKPLPEPLAEQIRARLAERRVVQHLPADMSGLNAEQTVWRIVDARDRHPSSLRLLRLLAAQGLEPKKPGDDMAWIVRRIRKEKGAAKPSKLLQETDEFWIAYDEVSRLKLVGLPPDGAPPGKLQPLKAVKLIGDNYGVALDPEPTIIPFHQVWRRLQALRAANGGKMPRVIRNGQLIQVTDGNFKGTWRVFSVKNNATGLALDLGWPDIVRLQSKGQGQKREVRLASLQKAGLQILRVPLPGIPAGH